MVKSERIMVYQNDISSGDIPAHNCGALRSGGTRGSLYSEVGEDGIAIYGDFPQVQATYQRHTQDSIWSFWIC